MPTFIDEAPLPPPPAARIARLEESFAHTLPADYLAFLREHNGARLATPTLATAEREVVIERFLPVVADPAADPQGWADVAVVATQLDARLAASEDSLGFDLVPFAALFGSDFLVFDYRQAAAPSVAIWLHESSEEFAPDARPIAPSFAAFLDALA